MFGYNELKDEISLLKEGVAALMALSTEQSKILIRLEESMDDFDRRLEQVEDSNVGSFSRYEETLTRWENLNDNFTRFNNMINEFKGLVAIVRGGVAETPKPKLPRGRPRKVA